MTPRRSTATVLKIERAVIDVAAALREGREAEERQVAENVARQRELERQQEIEKERDSIADRDRGYSL